MVSLCTNFIAQSEHLLNLRTLPHYWNYTQDVIQFFWHFCVSSSLFLPSHHHQPPWLVTTHPAAIYPKSIRQHEMDAGDNQMLDANGALIIGQSHISIGALLALTAPFASLLALFFFAKCCISSVINDKWDDKKIVNVSNTYQQQQYDAQDRQQRAQRRNQAKKNRR